MNLALPTILVIVVTIIFMTLERIFPGRELPNSKGWYLRAILITGCQIAITLITNKLWVRYLGSFSFFHVAEFRAPLLEGFISWFVGTFFFYWWHRLRHANGFW